MSDPLPGSREARGHSQALAGRAAKARGAGAGRPAPVGAGPPSTTSLHTLPSTAQGQRTQEFATPLVKKHCLK